MLFPKLSTKKSFPRSLWHSWKFCISSHCRLFPLTPISELLILSSVLTASFISTSSQNPSNWVTSYVCPGWNFWSLDKTCIFQKSICRGFRWQKKDKIKGKQFSPQNWTKVMQLCHSKTRLRITDSWTFRPWVASANSTQTWR